MLRPAQGGGTAPRTAADEGKEERRFLLVTAQCLAERAHGNLLVVADPGGEGDERGCEPVLGRTQYQLLARRTHRLLPHDGEIVRLQNALRRAADLGVVSVLLLELLPQLDETGLRELGARGETVHMHEVVEVRRQRIEILLQRVDILADGDDVGIGCVDVLTELPQTVPYPGKIRLRNNAVSHAVASCSAIHHII